MNEKMNIIQQVDHVREINITPEMLQRAEDGSVRMEIEGVAVPYNTLADIGGWYREQFAPGSVEVPAGGIKVFYRHQEPIGKVTAYEDRDEGFYIKSAKISDTQQGRDAHQLALDGVIGSLSIGFRSIEYQYDEEEEIVTRTKVLVREVSLVPFPAYEDAAIAEVRQEKKEREKMSDTLTPAPSADELQQIREKLDDIAEGAELQRLRIEGLLATGAQPAPVDTRTAAEVIMKIASGDDSTIREYNEVMAEVQRAYDGGTTADATLFPAWVGDLTRIFDGSSGTLAQFFATGQLPSKGMTIEYGQLKSNTVQVGVQPGEGEDLPFGKVQLETKTAPVVTLGGYTGLSFQAIQRSNLPLVGRTMEALAVAAARAKKQRVRNAFITAYESQVTAGNTVELKGSGSSDWGDWLEAFVDAAELFDSNTNLPVEALIVDKATFIQLMRLEASDGRPVLLTAGGGQAVNTVGRINLPGLTGSLAGLPVLADVGLHITEEEEAPDPEDPPIVTDVPAAAFVHSAALRQYDSPIVQLQDSNIVNLTQEFSIYRYSAIATEIPSAIVPLVM